MTDIDPAIVARTDQSIAALPELVLAYAAELCELMAENGQENGIALFATWLAENHTPRMVATLATGALHQYVNVRLHEMRGRTSSSDH